MSQSLRSLVVAPHPDDEVLGVGGTLLRRKSEGASIAWLIMTSIETNSECSPVAVSRRTREIKEISEFFGFDQVFELGYPSAQLDQIPMRDLVSSIAGVLETYSPNEIFLPHSSDIHSDHRVTFEAVASASKWFRCPSVKRVLAYETISETDFGLENNQGFRPNTFVNIDDYLENKLRAISIYSSEVGDFPFPRSHEAISALAKLRGANSGYKAAEAFELLREFF
jgi:LmbE family N-acetylglucosaminyl deacetylase